MLTDRNTKFIILTTQRTGSTLLWRYLNGHPEISAHGEMFLDSLHRSDSYSEFLKKSFARRVLHWVAPRRVLNEYFNDFFRFEGRTKAIGFKLMYSQLFYALERWLYENQVHVIHFVRANTLKLVLSRLAARVRKQYHAFKKSDVAPARLHVPPRRLIRLVKRNLINVEKYRRSFRHHPYIEISYEGFINERQAVTRQITDFIDVEDIGPMPLPSMVKMNPDDISDILLNYDEVLREFSGTPYEKYLMNSG